LLKGGQESQQRQEFKKNYKGNKHKRKKTKHTDTHNVKPEYICPFFFSFMFFSFRDIYPQKNKNKQTNK
jgi:hypothetical protein